MKRKITIRSGMSKHQIKRQFERALNDAVNRHEVTWRCGHGHTHKIRLGNIPKGSLRTLWCGCTVTGK